eukprot:gb/GECG01016368.1/.p1 GENE.gb/GECG01016368.1/~~gb/GECG01016368.1/.p1  ORF type:complete len:295 (+),score=43.35 gb/GECG01016368.1/:1-885(+)
MSGAAQNSVLDAKQMNKHYEDLEKGFAMFLQALGLPKWEQSEKELKFAACEVAFPFLNSFSMIRFPDAQSLEAKIREAIPKNSTINWGAMIFPHTTPKNAKEVLENIEVDGHKLFPMAFTIAGMVLPDAQAEKLKDGEDLAKRTAPGTGVTVSYLTQENAEEFARVQFLANGMPDVKEMYQKLAEAIVRGDTNTGSQGPVYEHILVWANEKLVAIGSYLMVDPDVSCIFEMATLPDERRKGYGTIVLQKIVHDSMKKHGAKQVILHGTEMGQQLYTNFGFVKTCDIFVLGHMAS